MPVDTAMRHGDIALEYLEHCSWSAVSCSSSPNCCGCMDPQVTDTSKTCPITSSMSASSGVPCGIGFMGAIHVERKDDPFSGSPIWGNPLDTPRNETMYICAVCWHTRNAAPRTTPQDAQIPACKGRGRGRLAPIKCQGPAGCAACRTGAATLHPSLLRPCARIAPPWTAWAPDPAAP